MRDRGHERRDRGRRGQAKGEKGERRRDYNQAGGRRWRRRRPVFVASASAPAADKKAREFPEILSEGLIAIIIVEWVGVARHRGG